MRINLAQHIRSLFFLSGCIYHLMSSLPAMAQEKKKIPLPPKKPAIAALSSALIPGAGQLYNQKYWKAPLFWAALGGAGYLIYSNNNTYAGYRDALKARTDNDPVTSDPYSSELNESDLIALQDQYRRNRDLWIILATLGYGLNIVDALVDAHLSSFDVSDDLSFHLHPAVMPGGLCSAQMRISWKF